MLLLNFWVYTSYERGITTAEYNLKKYTFTVRMVMTDPGFLGTTIETQTLPDGKIAFVFDDLHFLTFNDGRYFLYKSVNSRCQPEQVYIAEEEKI